MGRAINRPHLPARVVPVLLFFSLVGALLYILPLWDVPGPDVTEWYRYWAADVDEPGFMEAVPAYIEQHGPLPAGPMEYYLNSWYPNTERLDVLNIIYIWWGARLGGMGNGWRIIVVLSASVSLGLFYLMCLRLDISRSIAMLLALSMFFVKMGWLENTQSEPRGLLFTVLALYIILVSDRWWVSCLSAVSMLAAVLIKETFVTVQGVA